MSGAQTVSSTLAACELTLRAGERVLLRDFSQTFGAGELWCVAGPNGAGKTTLLSTLAGLVPPSRGFVALDDVPIGDWRPGELAKRRALMPQNTHDAFSASVFDIVLLNRFPYSVVYRTDDQRIVIVAVAHAHRRPAYWRGRIG